MIWQIDWIFDLEWTPKLLVSLVFTFLVSCYGPLITIHSQHKYKNKRNQWLQILSLLFWGLYFLILYDIGDSLTHSEWLMYFWIVPLIWTVIPLIIASIYRKEQLKIRFSRSALFQSILLWWLAGSIVRWWVAWALGSIEALFDVYIDSDRYLYIGILSVIFLAGSFVFNYYLTLVEKINKKSDFKIEKSRIRRIFWFYIFLSLAIIYLLIFWAYWIKILITWIWPKWIIVWLWIWYFILWIISLYVIYPDKTKYHEIINKILYVSFILVALMMIGAILQRINQYWITINRCFVCYIIGFIIIYSVLSLIFPQKRLLSFVSVLFILWILALYWPFSVSNISYKSQLSRLETLLSETDLSLPLWEWALENISWEPAGKIMWVLEELTKKYSEKKIKWVVLEDYIIGMDNNATYYVRWALSDYLKVWDYGLYDTSYNEFTYYNFWQNTDDEKLDIEWFSKLCVFNKTIFSSVLVITLDDQEYTIDLSENIDELLQKAELNRKSYLTNEEKEILKDPALIVDKDDFRIIITWFSAQKNNLDGSISFDYISWYFLLR